MITPIIHLSISRIKSKYHFPPPQDYTNNKTFDLKLEYSPSQSIPQSTKNLSKQTIEIKRTKT